MNAKNPNDIVCVTAKITMSAKDSLKVEADRLGMKFSAYLSRVLDQAAAPQQKRK